MKTKLSKIKMYICTVFLVLGMFMSAQAQTADATFIFGTTGWTPAFPTTAATDANVNTWTYNATGQEIKTYAATSNARINNSALLFGGIGSYIELPAFTFDVDRIEVVSNTGSAAGMTLNIFVGTGAGAWTQTVSTAVSNASPPNTMVFNINPANQAAGTVYRVQNTVATNSQVTQIRVYKVSADPTVTIAPTSLNFGGIRENTSEDMTFTVTPANLSADLTLSIPTGSAFTLVSPATIPQATTTAQTVTVTFNPTAAQTYSDTLTISGGGLVSPAKVPLSGSGATNQLTANLSTIDFGNVMTNRTLPRKVNLTLNAAFLTDDVTFTMSGYAGFAVDSAIVVRPANDSLRNKIVGVTYIPTDTNLHTATLTISTPGVTDIVIPVTGQGSDLWFEDFEDPITGNGSYTGANVTFNTGVWRIVGMTTMDANDRYNGSRSIRLRGNNAADTGANTNRAEMQFDKPTGIGTVSFKYGSYSGHQNGTVWVELSTDQGATWTEVPNSRFQAPLWTGAMLSASVAVNQQGAARIRIMKSFNTTNTSSNGSVNVDDIYISDVVPLLAVDLPTPCEIGLGPIAENTTTTETFNVSGLYLEGDVTLTITGTNASVFTVTPSPLTPTAGTLAATEVTVTYAPLAISNDTATLTISSTNAADIVIALTGASVTAGTPILHFTDRTPLAFGNLVAEVDTEQQTINVVAENLDLVPTTIEYYFGSTGTSTSIRQFLVTEGTFDTVDGGTLLISFNPATVGEKLDTLYIQTADGLLTDSIALSGTGVLTTLTATPTTIDAGTIFVGDSIVMTVTVDAAFLRNDVQVGFIFGDTTQNYDMFTLDSSVLVRPANDSLINKEIKVTYKPTAVGTHRVILGLVTTAVADSTLSINTFATVAFTGEALPALTTFAAWNAQGTVAGDMFPFVATTVDATHISGTPQLSIGSGLVRQTSSPAGNTYPVNLLVATADSAAAIANNTYFEFSLTPAQFMQLDIEQLKATLRRTASGPNAFVFMYSLDGFATAGTAMGAATSYTTNPGDGQDFEFNDLLITGIRSTITFRLYIWGGTVNASQSFSFGRTAGNDLEINGYGSPFPTIVADPTHMAFGDEIIGDTTLERTLTVSGDYLGGNAISWSLTGADASAFIVREISWNNTTGGTLGVRFAPIAEADYSAMIVLSSLLADTVEVPLTGTGVPPGTPILDVDVDEILFGEVYWLGTSTPQTVTIAAANLTNLSYSLSDNTNFTVTPDANWNDTTGGTLDVVFNPYLGAGAISAWLYITSDELSDSVALSGTSIVATLSVSTTTVDAGMVIEGQSKTVTIRLDGQHLYNNVTLEILGANADMFSVNLTDIAPVAGTIDTAVVITYSPTEIGTHTATLNIDWWYGSPYHGGISTAEIQLNGQGIAQTPPVGVGDIIFTAIYGGGGNAGAPYNSKYVELFNTTGSDLSLDGLYLQYTANASITPNLSFSGSTPLSGIIPARSFYLIKCTTGAVGADLPVQEDFSIPGLNPAQGQGKFFLSTIPADTVVVQYNSRPSIIDLVAYGGNSGTNPVGISVTGTNLSATLMTVRILEGDWFRWHLNSVTGDFRNVNPTDHTPRNSLITIPFIPAIKTDKDTVNFGRQDLDSVYLAQTLVVTNHMLTNTISWTLGGADAAAFAVDASAFTAANGGTLSILFTPTAPRSYNATLTLSSAGVANKVVRLIGIGQFAGAPHVEFDINNITFPQQISGTTSAPQSVTVTAENLMNPITWRLTSTVKSNDFTVTPAPNWDNMIGGTLNIAFAPQTAGEKTAILYIESGSVYDSIILTGTTELEVPNIAAFKAATGSVTGTTIYKITGNVTFVFSSGRNFYIRDHTGGLTIDNNANTITGTYTNGDVISGGVTGTLTMYSGLHQLVPAQDLAGGTPGTPVVPITVTMSQLLANFAIYEAQLVRLDSVFFTADGTFGTGAAGNLPITQDGSEMLCRNHFGTFTNLAVTQDTAYNIIGFAIPFNADRQIAPRSANDIVKSGPVVSIKDFEQNSVVLYPNPVNDVLYIQAEQPISTVMIYNMSGQLVVQQHGDKSHINVSNLLKGTYIVRIIFDNGLTVSRVIVK
jgi:hypothetical protein